MSNSQIKSHVSILSKSSSFCGFQKLNRQSSTETLNQESIFGLNKILNSIYRNNMKNKILSEDNKQSIIIKKENFEKKDFNRINDLNSFRNSIDLKVNFLFKLESITKLHEK